MESNVASDSKVTQTCFSELFGDESQRAGLPPWVEVWRYNPGVLEGSTISSKTDAILGDIIELVGKAPSDGTSVNGKSEWVFRGQEDESWPVIPSSRRTHRTTGFPIPLYFSLEASLHYKSLIGPTINDAAATEHCRSAATRLAGAPSVRELPQVMGGEDFGGFLEQRPGAFMVIGQADPDPASPCSQGLHSPFYDFNDSILPLAAEYFAELAEARLPLRAFSY